MIPALNRIWPSNLQSKAFFESVQSALQSVSSGPSAGMVFSAEMCGSICIYSGKLGSVVGCFSSAILL